VYHLVAAQSSFMTVHVADAYAQVHRLVSVVKMATVLKGYTTKNSVLACVLLMGKRAQCKGYSYINVSCLPREVFVA
jgi:hypothetical protein